MATQQRTVIWAVPVPGTSIQARSGTVYTPDINGHVIAPVTPTRDIEDLLNAGAVPVVPTYIGKLLGANMNVTTDQAIPLFIPPSTNVRITRITVTNASLSLTTAAGGIYPAASKGGTAIVAAGQVYSSLTVANKALDLTIVAATVVYPPTAWAVASGQYSLYLSLTTAQGAASTADLYVYGDVYE